jgi:cyclopropane-fatty-acyl-phospholipid synthase
MRRIQQRNSQRAARRHAAHHYDLSHEHYRQFLDTDLQYSCAYFADPNFSLEQAQEAKKRRIAAKLLLEPGLRVLDIGCGWGGLALSLAEMERVEVVGVTLSREQLTVARQRATQARVDDRVRFELSDYREIEGRFDRIVSVGMFEHVGVPNYAMFFAKIRDLLSVDGVALIHSIGRINGPDITSAWTRKYIFPGGTLLLFRRLRPPSSAADCCSATWRSGACIMRKRYVTGVSVFWPATDTKVGFTMSDSAACGSFTLPPANGRSAMAA